MALTSTVTFRTTPELKERVDNLAKRTRRSAGFYYNILLEDYLSEIEDIYDAVDISERVRAGKEKTYSSDGGLSIPKRRESSSRSSIRPFRRGFLIIWMKSDILRIPEAEAKLLSRTCEAYGAIASEIIG